MKKLSNGEYAAPWRCPRCERINLDSVCPIAGPWFSCACGHCGASLEDRDLDAVSLRAWQAARDAAETDFQSRTVA